MKKSNRISTLAVLASMAIFLPACVNTGGDDTAVEEVILDPPKDEGGNGGGDGGEDEDRGKIHVRLEVTPGSATLRTGWREEFSAVISAKHVWEDGREEELAPSQEIDWHFPELAGTLQPIGGTDNSVRLVTSGTQGTFKLEATSVEYPQVSLDINVRVDRLGFGYPPVVPKPGSDSHQVDGDTAMTGTAEEGYAYIGFFNADTGDNYLERQHQGEEKTLFNAFWWNDDFDNPEVMIRIAANDNGVYWVSRNFDGDFLLNRWLIENDFAETWPLGDALEIATGSDIAIDSEGNIYFIAIYDHAPTLSPYVVRIDNPDFTSNQPPVVRTVQEVDLSLDSRPRLEVDDMNRLLLAYDQEIKRFTDDGTTFAPDDFSIDTEGTISDLTVGGTGVIFAIVKQTEGDQDQDGDVEPGENSSNLEVFNELGVHVATIDSIDPSEEDSPFTTLETVLGVAADGDGNLYALDDIHYEDFADSPEAAHLVRFDIEALEEEMSFEEQPRMSIDPSVFANIIEE